MKQLVLSILAIVAIAAPAAAQEKPEIRTGEIVSPAFDHQTPAPAPGRNVAFRVYIGNDTIDPVLGPPVSGTYTLNLPAFTVVGDKSLRVSARWVITDPNLWRCGTAGSDPTILDCAEAISTPLVVAVVPPTVPDPGTPGNLRIIRTTTVTETVIDPEGRIVSSTSNTSTRVITK